MHSFPLPRTTTENHIRGAHHSAALRAWAWSVGVVTAFVVLAVTLGVIVWAAATKLGPIPALIAGLILFCLVVGTAVWLGNGKQRP